MFRHNATISAQWLAKLIEYLHAGRSTALLGPRGAGKSFVLKELAHWAARQGIRAIELHLRPQDCRSGAQLLEQIEVGFGRTATRSDSRPYEGERLAGALEDVLIRLSEAQRGPVWVLVRGILDISTPLARSLLGALQSLSNSRSVGVVVTGTQDFVPLTYGANSPYRDVPKFIITGMDPGTTAAYVVSRRRSTSLVGHLTEFAAASEAYIDPTAVQLLHHETGGYMHLIEQILVTIKRHPTPSCAEGIDQVWGVDTIRNLVDTYLEYHIENDLFIRESLRAVERYPAGFDLLVALTESERPQPMLVMRGQADECDLELGGIVRADDQGCAVFASPIWRRHIRNVMSSSYVADVYVRQNRWDDAWRRYGRLSAFERDRPTSGNGEERWQRVLMGWQNSFFAKSAEGKEALYRHFTGGLRYLFGFDSGGIYDLQTTACEPVVDLLGTAAQTDIEPPSRELRDFGYDTRRTLPADEGLAIQRDLTQRRLRCELPEEKHFPSRPHLRPVLLLERRDLDREIDGPLMRVLHRCALTFWTAFHQADVSDHRAALLRLSERFEALVRSLREDLAVRPFGMLAFLEQAVSLLLARAGYRSARICLVDPRHEYVTAVVSGGETQEFADCSDVVALGRSGSLSDWDSVHRQVVLEGRSHILSSRGLGGASAREAAPKEHGALTIVPLKVGTEIIGTIHLVRLDGKPPLQAELQLLDTLGAELAVTLAHAKRLTLLQGALNNLPDEIRILTISKEIIFHNARAAGLSNAATGWLPEAIPYATYLRGYSVQPAIGLERAVEGARLISVHRLHRDERNQVASDWHLAPIRTFERGLSAQSGPVHDWLDGYVERLHDLSPLYRLYAAVNEWLAQADSKATAGRILTYFADVWRSRWCRLYLVENAGDRGEFLRSFAQIGLREQQNIRRFEAGRVQFGTVGTDNYGTLLFTRNLRLALCRHDPNLIASPQLSETPTALPELVICESAEMRDALEKTDTLWIEAPLLVGETRVGLVSLSLPAGIEAAEDISASEWELLRWAVLGVAVGLYKARAAERQAQRRGEEAIKLASALAVHQIANKLLPVEAFLERLGRVYVPESDSLRASMERSRECVARSKAILNDFRRYASNTPFKDTERLSVHALFKQFVRTVLEREPKVGGVQLMEPVPDVSVSVQLDAFREIIEILATNSILHGGQPRPADVVLRLGAVVVSAPLQAQPLDRGNWVRFVIADNGIGIPDDQKEKIFEPFQTSFSQGTGLGLAIAGKFVARHGGFICEDGEYMKGASFSIYLPALPPREGKTHESETSGALD